MARRQNGSCDRDAGGEIMDSLPNETGAFGRNTGSHDAGPHE
jgi:hypothetical protein